MWARLHFGDGGTLDLSEGVDDWHRDSFEAAWRAVHVRVEWLRSPRGRLDDVMDSVMRNPPTVADSGSPPE